MDLEEIGTHFLVKMRRRIYVDNVPKALGSFVLTTAKLVQLRFYLDFLCYYLSKETFALVLTDTDSFYCSFSRPSIKDCIKPEKKQEFAANRDKWLACPDKPESRLIPLLYKEERTFIF